MSETRRKFRRGGESQRQGDLIAAALDLIAEGGPQHATVRAIAARAGVTPGLIRHYFKTKEELLGAAYATFMAQMTADHRATVSDAPPDPVTRLARFVEQSLSPQLVDARTVGLWAGFLHMVQRDPAMHRIHHDGYHAFRAEMETLIAAALAARGRPADAAAVRGHAIACNALIDGLWLEGSALPEAFAGGELAQIGLEKIGTLLALPLCATDQRRKREKQA